jgi:hypothetical protein
MSCTNGEVSTDLLISESNIYRFPIFIIEGIYSTNFKLATPSTDVKLSWQDILDRSKIRLPMFSTNGSCEDYITESVDFTKDEEGGIIWLPDIITCKPKLTYCRKTIKIFGFRIKVKYICGVNYPYSSQPYWELVDIPIPDKDFIKFNLPQMEFTGNITVGSSFSIGGFLYSSYMPIVNLFISMINGNTNGSSVKSHMIIILSTFINILIQRLLTGEFNMSDLLAVVVGIDVLQVTYNIKGKNINGQIGSNKFNIPNFSDDRVFNFFSFDENRYLTCTFKSPTPPGLIPNFSIDLNVFYIDIWPLIIQSIKLYESLQTKANSLITKISPYFENILSMFGKNPLDPMVIFDWLGQHFALGIGISFKICPANLVVSPTNPVPLVPISLCYTLVIGFQPFTEKDTTYINNKISRGLSSITDEIDKLKLPKDANDITKTVAKLFSIPSGYGFNETIVVAIETIKKENDKIIKETIDTILKIHIDIGFTQCFAPPIPIPV